MSMYMSALHIKSAIILRILDTVPVQDGRLARAVKPENKYPQLLVAEEARKQAREKAPCSGEKKTCTHVSFHATDKPLRFHEMAYPYCWLIWQSVSPCFEV